MPEEERKREKNMSELLKTASMTEECWRIVKEIHAAHPSQRIYIYRNIQYLSSTQAEHLLKDVQAGKIAPNQLPKMCKEQPAPKPEDTMAMQRLREKVPLS